MAEIMAKIGFEMNLLTTATLVVVAIMVFRCIDTNELLYMIQEIPVSTLLLIVWEIVLPVVILLFPWINKVLGWPIPECAWQIACILFWVGNLKFYCPDLLHFVIKTIQKIGLAIMVVESGAWAWLTTFVAGLHKNLSGVAVLNKPVIVYGITVLFIVGTALWRENKQLEERNK